jgi:hypothetical protein
LHKTKSQRLGYPEPSQLFKDAPPANQRLQIGFFAESHAAAIKHMVIMVERTIGVVKAYLKLKAVTAAKQMASAHAVRRMRAKVSAGRPPSCHANTAANKRNTEKKSPNALKKSQ